MSETSKAIESAVNARLESWGIVFTAVLVGPTVRKDWGHDGKPWQCDQWRAEFYKMADRTAPLYSADYYTGTGHRIVPAGQARTIADELRKSGGRETLCIEEMRRAFTKPVAPSAASVLHSLTLDASAADSSFADWCADMGMNSDSIKDLHTYQACCAIGQELRKLFTGAQMDELRDILQDY